MPIDAPHVWDLAWLESALADDDLARATGAVDAWTRADPANPAYRDAALLCAGWRRHDLAATIRLAAFRAGVDPYEAAYAVDVLWRVTSSGAESAVLAEALTGELSRIAFTFQGDAFHIDMVTRALADLARLARYDDGEIDLEAALSPPMHAIAVDAVWRRIWPAHNALQFKRAQRLAQLYVRNGAADTETTFYVVETFFVDYGGAAAAFDILDALDLDDEQDLRRQALCLAMAYETGDVEKMDAALARIDARAENPDRVDAVEKAIASSMLYRARRLFNDGDGEAALAVCRDGVAAFPDRPWRGAFDMAMGAIVEATDLTRAMMYYEKGLAAEISTRTPFGLYSVADACAAAQRFDLTYAIFERYAAKLRPHYGALAPGQSAYGTSTPETFPQSALFLSGWSVGDDTFRYGLLRSHFREGDYTVMLDSRLIEMAKRAQPDWNFLAHTRVSERGWSGFWRERAGTPEAVEPLRCPQTAWRAARRHGAVVMQEDMLAVHAARRMLAPFPNETAAFEPDPDRVETFRAWLESVGGGRASIALSWRSGLYTTSRAFSFFSAKEMGELIASAPAAWVLLQYDWVQAEIDIMQDIAGSPILIHPDLDIRNDLEGVAAMARACDLVMSTGVATREISAAAGANVYSISFGWPYADAWRRDPDDQDTIFPSMRHAKPGDGRTGVLKQAQQLARVLCANRS
jgi:hypothetical protein